MVGIVGLGSISLDQLFKVGVWNLMMVFFFPIVNALGVSDQIFFFFQNSYLAAGIFIVAVWAFFMVIFWIILTYLLHLLLKTKKLPFLSSPQRRKNILCFLLVMNLLVFCFHLLQSLVPSFNVR